MGRVGRHGAVGRGEVEIGQGKHAVENHAVEPFGSKVGHGEIEIGLAAEGSGDFRGESVHERRGKGTEIHVAFKRALEPRIG